jgi:hypothetical protein
MQKKVYKKKNNLESGQLNNKIFILDFYKICFDGFKKHVYYVMIYILGAVHKVRKAILANF